MLLLSVSCIQPGPVPGNFQQAVLPVWYATLLRLARHDAFIGSNTDNVLERERERDPEIFILKNVA
jgi:hypothetical protein